MSSPHIHDDGSGPALYSDLITAGGLGADPDAITPKALRFTGDYQSSFHGDFWTPGVDLGQFLWEFFCRFDGLDHPSEPQGYLISEGYGGAHSILYGLGPAPSGNIWNGSAVTSFSGSYVPQVGEWLDTAVGWDGTTVYMWVNGILDGMARFAGPRQAQATQGTLFLGGSDHSNFQGALAAVRAFEYAAGGAAMPNLAPGIVGSAYSPEPIKGGMRGTLAAGQLRATNAYDFTSGSLVIPDVGTGYGGLLRPGKLVGHYGAPVPSYEADPSFPGLVVPTARTRTAPTPSAAPSGCTIFDSFGREDSIPAFVPFVNPHWMTEMGSTEGGSLGPLAWQNDNAGRPSNMWGIFDHSAIFTGTYMGSTWVLHDSPDMDVRITRSGAAGYRIANAAGHFNPLQSTDISLCFRLQDANNYLYSSVYHDQFGNNFVRFYARVGGGDTQKGEWTLPNYTWNTLRFVLDGTSVSLYVDGVAIGSPITVTEHSTQVGVGLNQQNQSAGAAIRWKDFTVYPVA